MVCEVLIMVNIFYKKSSYGPSHHFHGGMENNNACINIIEKN